MIESVPQPGLTGKTIVVIDAADTHGPAVCGSLLASGANVVATGSSKDLPASLVDAGTGLDGELHYRPLASPEAWGSVADWIGTHAEKLHGIVGSSDGVARAAEVLATRLAKGGALVSVGPEASAGAHLGIRSNAVVLAGGRGSRHEDVGNAVAFLLSDLAELVDGAVIPIGERPADAI